MIFLTIGTQLPFERLVKMLDEWANVNPDIPIFAQIGDSSYQPMNFNFCRFLGRAEYEEKFNRATVVVAHAGIGSILNCLVSGKSVIVSPRLASLGEHRNEHQLATCKKVAELQGCYVAYDQAEFFQLLDNMSSLSHGKIGEQANPDLLEAIENFIND